MPHAGSWSCRTPGAGQAARRELVRPHAGSWSGRTPELVSRTPELVRPHAGSWSCLSPPASHALRLDLVQSCAGRTGVPIS